ncbi:hypothetical protein F5Y14DRAFT_20783 [Nemania sp. NC0429]|nr:hypothetical protein F5Y14DRAFT_20783 [Nemania sp. NC0429]
MGARTRSNSQREAATEPQEGPVTRSTRRNAKYLEPGIPQRGTRRQRRRSMESVATNDLYKGSPEPGMPDLPSKAVVGTAVAEDVAASDPESQDDSDDDRAARLQDLFDFDLPKLCRWCEKAFDALSALTNVGPIVKERKDLNTARKSFNLARRPFAQGDAAYIDLSSSDLPYQDHPDVYAAIHKATRSANLISLLLSLTDIKRTKKANFLRELDSVFPSLLDPGYPARAESYDLAFRVRCCRLAESLEEEPNTNPLVLAATIFCEQSTGTPAEATQRLRNGPFRSYGGIDKGEVYTASEIFNTQMEKIVITLSSPPRAQIEAFLKAEFPRGKLLEALRIWALDMYTHVNRKAHEGDLPQNDQNVEGADDDAGREEPENLVRGENVESEGGSDSEPSSENEGYNKLPTLAKEPSFIQDSATLASVRQSEKGVSKRLPLELSSNKRIAKEKLTGSQMQDAIRRLLPADVLSLSHLDAGNAGGTPPLSIRTLSSRPRSGSRSPSDSGSQATRPAGKRTHSHEDGDYVDEDNDFEVNRQVIDESRRIQYEDPNVPNAVPKRPRFSGDSNNTRDRQRSPEDRPANPKFRDGDLATLTQVARANRLANKMRKPQTREKWSDVDTDQLIDFIANESLGCSWSRMEEEGEKLFQTKRNQQAIRDKARNLKKGYLRADAILPSGFDLVRLGKKERDDVIAAGRNPDRMEDDIDEQGRVTHNLWRESESPS